jgi:hypothetical protein
MLEHQLVVLVVPVLALVIMLALFPTEHRNRAWVSQRQQQLEEMQQSPTEF